MAKKNTFYEVCTVPDAITATEIVACYGTKQQAVAEARSLAATNQQDYWVTESRRVYSTLTDPRCIRFSLR